MNFLLIHFRVGFSMLLETLTIQMLMNTNIELLLLMIRLG